ncbi:MAG: alpha/beta hydrolase [Candidatus Magasanikbacteria bacterium]|nr:alpha/beta hydrolase [Candidatus Magasanikbacteria bacterium]
MISVQRVISGILTSYDQYQPLGSPRPEILLYLHGWRSEKNSWRPLAERLADCGWGGYALDLPGFGGTAAPPDAWSLGHYAEFIKQFIAALSLKQVCLVGHSFGGRIGIKLAAGEAALFSKLVLVGTPGATTRGQRWRVVILKSLASLAKPLFRWPALRGARHRIYRAIGAEDYLARLDLQPTFQAVIGEDLTSLLRAVRLPTLLLWGERDLITLPAVAALMQRRLPEAHLALIPGAGHFPWLDNLERSAEIIRQFLPSGKL